MKDLICRMGEKENFSWKEFIGEHAALQPAYTWVWNAPILREEIRKQLDEMLEAGIRTVYILPEPKNFRAYNERIHMAQEYLSAEFFEEMRYAIEYALDIGMSCWMYDEGGWPSGSACGAVIEKHPDLCRKSLCVREARWAKGEAYRPGERTIAAFALKSDGERSKVRPGEWAKEDCRIAEYYVRWHEGMVVDSLDEEVGRAFVESTHNQYEKYLGDLFGTEGRPGKLPMMFTDEPGAGRYAWPRGFEKRFSEKYGYDIAPFVPVLLNEDEETDEAGIRARIDYRQLAGEMFRDHYFRPIHEWGRKNHVLSTGHLDIDHRTDGCLFHNYGSVLNQLREMDVPGIDVIWRQITKPKENEPACEEGNGFFTRFAASAAAQSGGKYAVSESFAVYGAGLVGEEMRYVINHQLVRGINLFNFMSMSYGKTDAVPAVMRPAFLSEMPGYAHLRAINDYTARACYLMQLGESGVRTAVYLPNRDIWAAGSCGRSAIAAFDRLGQELERRQVEFDVIDDDGIRMAKRVDGALHLGNAKYERILIPECRYMPEDVRDKLEGISGEAAASVGSSSEMVRVRTRLMDEGRRIYMLFNESGREIKADISIPYDGNICRLDLDHLRAESVSADLKGVKLVSGGAEFYLCSKTKLNESEAPIKSRQAIAQINEFAFRKLRTAWLDERGIHAEKRLEADIPAKTGCWQELVGREFSGEAVYAAEIDSALLKLGKLYELDLGKVESSARVFINGKYAGTAWAEPKCVRFNADAAGKDGRLTIEIEVANTLANQFTTQPLDKMFPSSELGPYQERLKVLEENAPVGGLYGPVVLYELTEQNGGGVR